MYLSASHGIAYMRLDESCLSAKESFTEMKDAGFDALDVGLWHYCSDRRYLLRDDWEKGLDEICAAAAETGLPVNQTHGDTMTGMQWDDPAYPRRAEHFEMLFRCIEGARRLGAKYMVMHPYNLPHKPLYSVKENREACIAYLAPYIEAAKKAGICIAVENMVDFGRKHRRYCGGDIYELIDLVDTINDPSVGICLDTGHANISGINPAAAVRAIGKKRLFCTHINDNHAQKGLDEHLFPYFGDIDWASVVRALKEIGYENDFSYEACVTPIPDEFRPAWLRYTVELGRHLLSIE